MNLSDLLRRWRALTHKDELDQELDEEMQFHLERDIERNVKDGMSNEEARYAALRSFNRLEQSKEECRNARGVGRIEDVLRDVTYSLRVLLKSYGFTIVVVLTLALGIGANTAIFSFANGILLRPLPYPQSDRLVVLDEMALKQGISIGVAYPNFLDWREQNRVFEGVATHYGTSRFSMTLGGQPTEIRGSRVSYGLFEVLHVWPLLGRTFTLSEDRPEEDNVVILGYDLWQRNFGGDSKIIGQKVVVSSRSRTVIGVMPRGFRFPEASDLWVPLAFTTKIYTRNDHGLEAIARLKDGVSVAQAQTEMNNLALRIKEQNPVTNEGLGVSTTSLHDNLSGNYRDGLLILLGVVGCVLLVACVNVANLMLARATARQKEFALRAALGASRWRIMRQLILESLLLALAGGILGFVLSIWALRLLLTAIPIDLPFWMNFSLDLRVLGFTLAITLLTGLIFGVVPALQTSRVDLNDTLKEGGRGNSGLRSRARNLLVVAEIAMSLVLLVGAGLMVQSFLRLRQVNIGLNTKNVLTATLVLPRPKYDEDQSAAFFKQLMQQVQSLPGVESASATKTLPLAGNTWGRGITVEGFPVASAGQAAEVQHTVVTPGYFRTMGISLMAGRDFNDSDAKGAPDVTIIDERLARQYWPNESALGKRVRFGPPADNEPWHTIVGVVSAVRHQRVQEETRPSVYMPHQKIPVTGLTLVARTSSNPHDFVAALRREVAQLDRDLPISEVATMDEVVSESIWQPRLYAMLFAVFASGALLLALIGIYGVMAFLVQARTHEIGIRMALGASARDVFRLIVGRGMKLTAVGVVIGVGGAIALTRLMHSLLFNTSATDPFTFVLISLLLSLAALLACYIPARRAAKVDPLIALRYE
ncbi:MAG TPA: ABC transporter permease [Pyrinomonadaceae bacterium]|jgi:putative ABC transport system permease protein|nr:ABC transporter permease [Pyrinomonadaceae bacterium]